MIQIPHVNLDRLTPAERAAYSALSGPAYSRHQFDATVETFANNLLTRLVESHAAGKPIAEFLTKASEVKP